MADDVYRVKIDCEIILPEPHDKQKLFIDKRYDPYGLCEKKFRMILAGRRSGKTAGVAIQAVLAFLDGKRVLYAAPTAEQIDSFWSEVKKALHNLFTDERYKSLFYILDGANDHLIELRTPDIDPTEQRSQRIKCKTAFNADTLRGDRADLLILEEFSMMNEDTLDKCGYPLIIDTNGDLIIIFTPPDPFHRSAVCKAKDPRHAMKMFKQRKSDPNWLCLHYTMYDNPYISEAGREFAKANMTPLAYRQEILAQEMDEVPGALLDRKSIEKTRVTPVDVPALKRIVVGVDPSGSTTTECGIVVAGLGEDDHVYILQDNSVLSTPEGWASAAVSSYHSSQADCISVETNFGGDMCKSTIYNVDQNVPVREVHASRGKYARAEPIAVLFQQKRCHIVGEMPQLEDEWCSYVPGTTRSPNRYDACVWAATELTGGGQYGLLEWGKQMKESGLTANEIINRSGNFNAAALSDEKNIEKIPSENMAAVATNDQTPGCKKCGCNILHPVGGGGYRCAACGDQAQLADLKQRALSSIKKVSGRIFSR